MDLKQNTEFILSKIDSLMSDAMPYLEKGAEEMIMYQIVKFQVGFLLSLIIASAFFLAGSVSLYKGLKAAKKNDYDEGVWWGFVVVGGVICVGSFIGFLGEVVGDVPKFALSFATPEMFAIMELLGK